MPYARIDLRKGALVDVRAEMIFDGIVRRAIIKHLKVVKRGKSIDLKSDEIVSGIFVAQSLSKPAVVQVFANDNTLRRDPKIGQAMAEEIVAQMKQAGYHIDVLVHVLLGVNLWGETTTP